MTLYTEETDAEFMRSVLAASDDCIKVISLDGKLTFMSEGGQRVMEVSDFNLIRGCPWPDFWEGPGNADAKAAIIAAREGMSARFQGQASTMAGNRKWWDVQVSPIMDRDGKPTRILSVSRDITELKLAEERHQLLGQELQHRMKNTFAMIQSIVNQTFRPGETLENVKTDLTMRLKAMSGAQELLTRKSWLSASMVEIAGATLAPHDGGGQIRFSGPDIDLSSQNALAMALALHELATNAAKYGALSAPGGAIDVVWSVEGDAEPLFRFSWSETGGPEVSQPSRIGFGTRMIERALAGYVNGVTQLEYRTDGVVFTLEAPLASVVA